MVNKNLMPVFDSHGCPWNTVFFLTVYFSTVQNVSRVFSVNIVFMILGLLLHFLESEILSTAKYTMNLLTDIYKGEEEIN